MSVESRSTPGIFDREIVVPKCSVNRYGEANCDHVHARDLPGSRVTGWDGEGEAIPTGWTAQSSSDPRVGQQVYECSLCAAQMTLDETTTHECPNA